MLKLLIKLILLIVAGGLTASCTQQTSVETSDLEGTQLTGKLDIDKVYPTSDGEDWVAIESAGRTYIKGLDFTAKGTCSRGVKEIRVNEGGADYPETAACDAEGNWTWSKTFTTAQEGDKTLTFTAYAVGNIALNGATKSQDVRIDNTAPTAPVVTSPPNGSNYNYSGSVADYVFEGNCSTDTVKLTKGPIEILPASNSTWAYTQTLIEGALTELTFYSFDLAGNRSAPTTISITWNPSASPFVRGVFPGGFPVSVKVNNVTNNTLFKIETSMTPPSDFSSVSVGGQTYELYTGLNGIVNQLRAD